MPYDQSWMGFGWTGALEAGAISLAAGIILLLLTRLASRGAGWTDLRKLTVAFLIALLLSGGRDLGNLFYFSLANVQSIQLLSADLAEVHDPDGMGLRALAEVLGAALGTYLAWAATGGHRRR